MTVTTVVADGVGGQTSTWPAMAFAAGVSLLFVGLGVDAGLLVAWVMPVVWAATIDARVSHLPDRVVLPGLAVFMAVLVVASAGDRLVGLRGVSAGRGRRAGRPVAAGASGVAGGVGLRRCEVRRVDRCGGGAATGPAAVVLVFVLAAVVQLVVVWWRPLPAQRVAGSDRRSAPLGPAMAVAAGRLGAGVADLEGWCVMRLVRPLVWLVLAGAALVGFVALGA